MNGLKVGDRYFYTLKKEYYTITKLTDEERGLAIATFTNEKDENDTYIEIVPSMSYMEHWKLVDKYGNELIDKLHEVYNWENTMSFRNWINHRMNKQNEIIDKLNEIITYLKGDKNGK